MPIGPIPIDPIPIERIPIARMFECRLVQCQMTEWSHVEWSNANWSKNESYGNLLGVKLKVIYQTNEFDMFHEVELVLTLVCFRFLALS